MVLLTVLAAIILTSSVMTSYAEHDPSKYTDPENQTINMIQYITQPEESEIEILPSPRQQAKDGIPNNEIMCRDGHTLVIRTASNLPICVSPQTADLLVLRGFAMPIIDPRETDTTYEPSLGTYANGTKSTDLSTLEIMERFGHRQPKDPSLSISSAVFLPGDMVTITGYAFDPHSSLIISIISPSEETVKRKLLASAEDRFFESKFFTVPHGVPHGTWKIQIQEGENYLESTFEVVSPQPAKKTTNETFDISQCRNTDDPLINYKCWKQEQIMKNINCQGLKNYTENDCHPPDSVYRKPPSFYQNSYADIIPQDITFDYALKAPPDDVDAFAQKLVNFMDDTIVEKMINGGVRYETEKGQISFSANMRAEGFGIEYSIFGAGRNHDTSMQFTADLLDELGIILDGTEFYREHVPNPYYSHKLIQQKDGIKIVSNSIATRVEPGWTSIHMNNWNNNLSEMNLYDVNESIKNGQDFALNHEQLSDISCQLEVPESSYVTLVILEGRPLYDVNAGRCQVNYSDGHAAAYSVFVDALTGEPLFIEDRIRL